MPENESELPAPEPPPRPQSNPASGSTGPPPPEQSSFAIQMLLGFVAFLLIAAAAGSAIAISALRAPGNQPWLLLSVILAGLGVIVLVWRAGRGPGLLVGFLIGLGLVGLAFGLCFAAMR